MPRGHHGRLVRIWHPTLAVVVGAVFGAVGCPVASAQPGPWSDPVLVSTDGAGAAAVLMNPRGDAAVAWRTPTTMDPSDASAKIESTTTPAGEAFSPARLLRAGGTDLKGPRMALDANGGLFAMWPSHDGVPGPGTPVAGGFQQAGGNVANGLGAPMSVGPNGLADDLAVDARGDAVEVRTEHTSGQPEADRVLVARRRPGESFGALQLLSDTGSISAPGVAVGPTGSIVLAWVGVEPGTSGPRQIYVARGSVDAPLGPPVRVSDLAYNAWAGVNPEVAVGADGTVAVAWQANVPPPSATGGPVPVSFNEEVHVAISPAGGAFGPEQRIDGGQTSLAPRPLVTQDGRGGVLVTWQAQLQPAFSYRPPGGTFEAPQLLPAAEGVSSTPLAGFDSRGNTVFAWHVMGQPRFEPSLKSAVRRRDGRITQLQTVVKKGRPVGVAFDGFGRGLMIISAGSGPQPVYASAYDSSRLDPASPVIEQVAIDSRGRVPSVRLRLAKPATVRVGLERLVRHRRGRRVGSFGGRGRRGANRIRLTLRRGRYRATVTALDVVGRPVARRRLSFRF
jgi:hypothetical protein